MSRTQFRLHPKIKEALEATGLPWELQLGKKHRKLMLNGKFITILQMTNRKSAQEKDSHSVPNVVASIRRAARDMKGNLT